MYPDAHTELNFSTPLELLVATILSAQTTDKRVNLVTPTLFARYATAADYAAADRDELEKIIQSTGFYHAKANSLMGLGQALCDRFGGEVPPRLSDLVTLPGVGRKTANVVLGNAFGIPGITVDTHFGRLARRFGWTTERRPGQDRGGGGHAHPAPGLDDALAPADLAWPPGLSRPAARLRSLRAGPAVPVLRRGTRRSGGRREACQARPVLVTAVSRSQPAWLRELFVAAAAMETEPQARPPVTGGRASAVLILFGAGPDGPDLLLIQRSDDLRLHAGQPAFPGGAIDATDSGPVAAALREAAEEVGVDPDGVDIVGTLPELFIPRTGFRVVPVLAWWREPCAVALPELFIPRTGFRVVPVLAWWREPCAVAPVDPAEVAAVERIAVSELTDPAARVVVRVPDGRTTPAFQVRGMLIWGFTALLVDRLLALAGWERPWSPAEVIDWAPPPGGPGSVENAIRLGSCTEMCSTLS